MHILFTRPLEDCYEMILKFQSLGHRISHLPLLKIDKVDYKIMVPGHGNIQTDNSALKKTQKYLQVLYDDVIDALKKDISAEKVIEIAAESEKNNWILFDRVNPGNVVRTFMRYEWEY